MASPRRAPPVNVDLVEDSSKISTKEEAEAFYRANLLGERKVVVKGQKLTIVFEKQNSHCFSEKPTVDPVPQDLRISRLKRSGVEVRQLSVERAALMGDILKTIENFSVAVMSETNVLVYGSPLVTGKVLRICLDRDTSRKNTWICYSAYPVPKEKWSAAFFEKNAVFP